MEEALIPFVVNPGVIKQLAPGVKEVCGPSPLGSCSIPQALGVSMECNARGDESRVKKGNVFHNSWQGTTRASNECMSSVWDIAKVILPSRQGCSRSFLCGEPC